MQVTDKIRIQDGNLTITNVTDDDRGYYMCYVKYEKNEIGTACLEVLKKGKCMSVKLISSLAYLIDCIFKWWWYRQIAC